MNMLFFLKMLPTKLDSFSLGHITKIVRSGYSYFRVQNVTIFNPKDYTFKQQKEM